jgi:biotin carboxyl carrier protein
MQDDSEHIELRSEEVQEILGTPPAWLVQTGSLLLMLIIGIMVLVAALVRYPDLVSERIAFTSASPPYEVLSSRSDVLERTLVMDGHMVEAGAPLAVWRSSARYADVVYFEQRLQEWRALPMDTLALVSWPSGLVLGEIMPAYRAFLADVNFPEEAPMASQMALQAQIAQAFDSLEAALDEWKRQHIIPSPISGKVAVNPDAMRGGPIQEGLLLLTILPPGSDALKGTMTLPIAGSGKIGVGQRVIIRLDHFPHQEFGVLEGVVDHVVLSARENACKVQVLLPHGLNTSFGVSLPDQSALVGKADIITDNRSFLHRVADQVFTGRQKPSFRNG